MGGSAEGTGGPSPHWDKPGRVSEGETARAGRGGRKRQEGEGWRGFRAQQQDQTGEQQGSGLPGEPRRPCLSPPAQLCGLGSPLGLFETPATGVG